jgi:thioesterase domain-containing protein/acyl carrier protein
MTPTIPSALDDAEADLVRRNEIDPGSEYVAPSGIVEERLAELWQMILRIDRVGRVDNFFELGGDSLQAISLVAELHKAFGVMLPPSTFIDHPTIAQLATLLTSDTKLYAERSLVPLQPDGAEPPLFLLHELGGNLFCYQGLVKRLGSGRKIYGIQHPGQNETPIPRFSIPELAGIYVSAIRRVQPEGPYLLGGFSIGGTVAYEMACQLRAQGKAVGLLVLFDAANRDGLVFGRQRLARKLSQHLAELSEREPSTWARYLLDQFHKSRRSDKPPPQTLAIEPPAPVPLPERVRELMYETMLAVHAEYDAPVFDGEVKLFRTNGGGTRWARRDYGWRGRALGGVDIIDVHGDHGSVLASPNVGLVAEYLSIWVDQTLRVANRSESV